MREVRFKETWGRGQGAAWGKGRGLPGAGGGGLPDSGARGRTQWCFWSSSGESCWQLKPRPLRTALVAGTVGECGTAAVPGALESLPSPAVEGPGEPGGWSGWGGGSQGRQHERPRPGRRARGLGQLPPLLGGLSCCSEPRSPHVNHCSLRCPQVTVAWGGRSRTCRESAVWLVGSPLLP